MVFLAVLKLGRNGRLGDDLFCWLKDARLRFFYDSDLSFSLFVTSAEGSPGSCLKGGQSVRSHSSFYTDLLTQRPCTSPHPCLDYHVHHSSRSAGFAEKQRRDLSLGTWPTILGTGVVTNKISSISIARSTTVIVNRTFIVLSTRAKPRRTWLLGGTAVGVATTSTCYRTASAIPGVARLSSLPWTCPGDFCSWKPWEAI